MVTRIELVLWGLVLLVAMAVGIKVIGDATAHSVADVERRGSIARAEVAYVNAVRVQRAAQRGCSRTLTDRIQGAERDLDLRGFAREAARARRVTGDVAVARVYDGYVRNADARLRASLGATIYAALDVDQRSPSADQIRGLVDAPHRGGRLVDCARQFPLPSIPPGISRARAAELAARVH